MNEIIILNLQVICSCGTPLKMEIKERTYSDAPYVIEVEHCESEDDYDKGYEEGYRNGLTR